MSYKQNLKEIEDEIKMLRKLNSTQGKLILTLIQTIKKIERHSDQAAKGTVLAMVGAEIARLKKKVKIRADKERGL